jgi:hypothetical protein
MLPRLLTGAAVTAGALALLAPSPGPDTATAAAVPPAAVGGTVPVVDVGTAPVPVAAPIRVQLPSLGVDSTLARLGVDPSGALVPPSDFDEAGWFAGGPAPGDVGPAVIAGHVDSRRGPAVFYDLRKLTRGDRIEVVRGGRALAFTVVATAWYPKNSFPTDEVYGPTPDRQLRLITCGGVFDRSLRSYKDNLVVYAVAG